MTEKKWMDDPKVVANAIYWKFIEGYSFPKVTNELENLGYNTTGNSVESRFKSWGLTNKFNPKLVEKSFDELYEKINRKLGISKIDIKPPSKSKSNIKTHLVGTDPHCPFYREDMAFYLIKTYGKGSKTPVDSLILGGDIFDCYSFSRFLKTKNFPMIDEFQKGIAYVTMLAEHFPEIIIVKGNHDDRVFKFFSGAVGIEATLGFVNYDWIKHVCNLLPNVFQATNTIGDENNGEHELCHYHILGKDCAVCHFEFSGGANVILKASQKVEQWSYIWRKYLPELSECNLYLQGHCFSEDTEILTDMGWKKYQQIKERENVATYNLETNNIEYQNITGKYVYGDFKELIHFYGSTHDILVTPDHAMVAKTVPSKYKRIEAHKICGQNYYIPVAGNNINEDYPISDEILKLLAWSITEGHYPKDSMGIRIAQSDKPKCGTKNITDICDKLGQSYSVIKRYDANTTKHGTHRNYNAYRIHLHSSDITRNIRDLSRNKQIQPWMTKLSNRQFKLFINELVMGDGTFLNNGFQYSSKYESEIDILQSMCLNNNYRSTKLVKKDNRLNNQTLYVLSINNKSRIKVHKSEKVKYDGKVWCVSVPNQTLIVRRNGKPFVCGNTHSCGKTAIHGGLKTVGETGHMAQIQEYAVRADSKYTPGVNAYWIVKQENGETIINDSNYYIYN